MVVAKSVSGRDMERAARREGEAGRARNRALEVIFEGIKRPKTRADCESGPRPCPWVACRHHMFLETSGGALKFIHGAETETLLAMGDTCSLDVAGKGARTLDQVGDALSLTRERTRQEEHKALAKIKRYCEARGVDLEALLDGGPEGFLEPPSSK